MRCVAAFQTCLVLLLAFVIAPFEHVHTGHGSGADHDHSGLIHSHFYRLSSVDRSVDAQNELRLVDADDDDHATAKSLDTFTLVLTNGLAPFVPTRGLVLLLAAPETFGPVEAVEEC